MQDVSRVTGDPLVVHSKVKGRDFILRGMTFEDLGVAQKLFLREKRQRVIEAAALRAECEPVETRMGILDKAQERAESIAYVSDQEFQAWLNNIHGAVQFLWVLFERQYPGVCSRSDITRMVATGEFPTDGVGELIQELFTGSSEGNSPSQGSTAA